MCDETASSSKGNISKLASKSLFDKEGFSNTE